MSSDPKNFLLEYVMDLLAKNGFGNLTDEQQKIYYPQILAHAQARLGLELFPRLSPSDQQKMLDLAASEKTTDHDWRVFWSMAVPNFDEIAQKVLADFDAKFKAALM